MNADAQSTTVTATARRGPPRHVTAGGLDRVVSAEEALTGPAYEPAPTTLTCTTRRRWTQWADEHRSADQDRRGRRRGGRCGCVGCGHGIQFEFGGARRSPRVPGDRGLRLPVRLRDQLPHRTVRRRGVDVCAPPGFAELLHVTAGPLGRVIPS